MNRKQALVLAHLIFGMYSFLYSPNAYSCNGVSESVWGEKIEYLGGNEIGVTLYKKAFDLWRFLGKKAAFLSRRHWNKTLKRYSQSRSNQGKVFLLLKLKLDTVPEPWRDVLITGDLRVQLNVLSPLQSVKKPEIKDGNAYFQYEGTIGQLSEVLQSISVKQDLLVPTSGKILSVGGETLVEINAEFQTAT